MRGQSATRAVFFVEFFEVWRLSSEYLFNFYYLPVLRGKPAALRELLNAEYKLVRLMQDEFAPGVRIFGGGKNKCL